MITFSGEGFRTPWHPAIRRLQIVEPTPAYPHALLYLADAPHPRLGHLIDFVATNYNSDLAKPAWVPDSDRALFGITG